jgi:hypothetical protein
MLRLAAVALCAFASSGGFGGGCGPGVPEPDRCDHLPTSVRVDSLELGSGNPDSLFQPWADEAVIPVTTGGQGSAMFPVRLRLRGPSVPACLPQRTVVTNVVGGTVALEASPLKTYEQEDGSRLTRTLWLVLDDEHAVDFATVETRVEGKTSTRTIWVGAPYEGPSLVSIAPALREIDVSEETTFVVTLSASATYPPLLVGLGSPAVAAPVSRARAASGDTYELGVVGLAPGSTDLTVGLGRSTVTARVTVRGDVPDAGL